MKFLFSKKSKQIENLSNEVIRLNHQLYYNRKDDYNDFISILEHIQETNNSKVEKNYISNLKKQHLMVENEINFAINDLRNKIMELDIKA